MLYEVITLEGLRCLDAGTLSFTLAEEIGSADALIVFDAARFRTAPGTVRLLEGADMDVFVITSYSIHYTKLYE